MPRTIRLSSSALVIPDHLIIVGVLTVSSEQAELGA